MNGILLINKETSWTSQDVCSKVKRLLHVDKVGHTGTLDPFAEGLLVLTINKGTKIAQFIEALNKTYIAKMELGIATDTLDKDGEIIERKEIPNISHSEIKEVFNSFLGPQKQLPPKYSAIKVNGKKLYEYARENIDVEIKEREVTINSLELIDFDGKYITFLADVSKGTYIRSLASDIALKLNTVGHLCELVRTRVGKYHINDAKKVLEVNENDVISLNEALSFMTKIKVDNIRANKIKNGLPMVLNIDEDLVYFSDENDNPLAVYKREKDNIFKSARGIF